MVHIADGILAPEVWISGFALTGVILAYTLFKTKAEEIPKLSLVTSAVFVASLIHIPIGPTSVHLILAGLAGVLLARGAYPSVFVALLLQAFLFQHGGITTLGINTFNIGIPALAAYALFVFGVNHTKSRHRFVIFGGLAGGMAVAFAVLLTSIALLLGGEEFFGVAALLAVAHVPVIIIEGVVIGSIIGFLRRVKPEMLTGVKE